MYKITLGDCKVSCGRGGSEDRRIGFLRDVYVEATEKSEGDAEANRKSRKFQGLEKMNGRLSHCGRPLGWSMQSLKVLKHADFR